MKLVICAIFLTIVGISAIPPALNTVNPLQKPLLESIEAVTSTIQVFNQNISEYPSIQLFWNLISKKLWINSTFEFQIKKKIDLLKGSKEICDEITKLAEAYFTFVQHAINVFELMG